VVGLGNPGDNYKLTRHNMGFMVIDKLAAQYNVNMNNSKFNAKVGEFFLNDEKVILVKPQTYMNSSGESVLAICNWYKLFKANLILVYDDIDIELGKLRIRERGSAGSHNGVKSVVELLNSTDFKRVRVGIGKPYENINLADYVLGRFTEAEQVILKEVIDKAKDSVVSIMTHGINEAMNRYN